MRFVVEYLDVVFTGTSRVQHGVRWRRQRATLVRAGQTEFDWKGDDRQAGSV